MEKVTVRKQFTLKAKDFLKGIYLAVIVPILVSILEVVQSGSFDLNLKAMALVSVSSLAAYLLKNYFAPTQVVVDNPNAKTVILANDKGGVHPPTNPIHPTKP